MTDNDQGNVEGEMMDMLNRRDDDASYQAQYHNFKSSLELDNRQLRDQLQSAEDEIARLTRKVKKAQLHVEDIEEEKAKLEHTLRRNQSSLGEKEVEITRLQGNIKGLKIELGKMQDDHEKELQKLKRDYEKELWDLKYPKDEPHSRARTTSDYQRRVMQDDRSHVTTSQDARTDPESEENNIRYQRGRERASYGQYRAPNQRTSGNFQPGKQQISTRPGLQTRPTADIHPIQQTSGGEFQTFRKRRIP